VAVYDVVAFQVIIFELSVKCLLLPIFGFPIKNKKIHKKIYSEGIKKKEWEKDAGTPIKWLEIDWAVLEIQELKFDIIFFY
jgi:hypothetical protein